MLVRGGSVAHKAFETPSHAMQGDLEQQYWAWANEKRRLYDFLSMLGSLVFATSSLIAHYSAGGVPDPLYTSAIRIMQAVSFLAAVTIVVRKQAFFKWRDTVMAIMWYSLVLAVLNTHPFVVRAVSRPDSLRAFISICCHRWLALAVGSLAWRVRIAHVPSVPFVAMLICALGAVRAAKAYSETGPGNLYMQFLCARLNSGLQSACTGAVNAVGVVTMGQMPANELASDLCQSAVVTQRHTVLLIWLVLHAVAFWVGFWYHLRDEVLDRKAFLMARTRWRSVELCAPSVKPMVLLMVAIQAYVFASLLLFGDNFV
eukprot:jgi/Botrbrau1/5370/Bobra.0346s0035.2